MIMKFILLINVKKLMIVGILTFICRINIQHCFNGKKSFNFHYFSFNEQLKFQDIKHKHNPIATQCFNIKHKFVSRIWQFFITSKIYMYAIGKPLGKSAYQKINFLISQPKHMLWVLKRTVSMRRFF